MDGEGSLFIVVEFGVGLAGFASIVIVLSREGTESHPHRRLDVVDLIGNALGAAFMALVPVAMHHASFSSDLIWRMSSFLLFAYQLNLGRWGYREARKAKTPLPRYYTLYYNSVGGVVMLAQVANVIGYPAAPQIAPFYVGLMWQLTSGATQFVRILLRRVA